MSTQADFTPEEWAALTEAPLQVVMTMFAAGQHGPISAIKESAAGAKAMTNPGNRGQASGLIAEIIPAAQSKETRHEVGHPEGNSVDEVITNSIAALQPAADALARLDPEEASGVGSWLVDIAAAVAGAAKGVDDQERETAGRIAAVFGVPAPTL